MEKKLISVSFHNWDGNTSIITWCHSSSNGIAFCSTKQTKGGIAAEFEHTDANIIGVSKHLVEGEWSV